MIDILTYIPPAITLILGGLLLPLCKRVSPVFYLAMLVILPVVTLAHVWLLPGLSEPHHLSLASFSLYPVYQHDFSTIFATIFAIAAFGGGIYAFRAENPWELTAAYFYAGSAIGVVYSGDFISMFLFWEMMAIGSSVVLFLSPRPGSGKAAMRYIYMHLISGLFLMVGIIGFISLTGDARITALHFDPNLLLTPTQLGMKEWMMVCVLLAVLINAAAPPLGSWLPDAYPESSPFGAVFLSAFTTKTSVFALLTLFAGNKLLIIIGLIMVFYGIVYAILENDMRRILAYSIMNQVGFMVTGIGIGTTLALQGTAAHAFCHIIYKALLFMSAGSVMYMTGKTKCTELGGLYRTMKVTMWCGIIGALSISAFPLTSGFVSKSLISSAAYYEGLSTVWLLLAAASAGVFLHAGIKFPWFVFFHRDSGMRPKDPPFSMQAAMIFFAALCLLPAIPGLADKTLYYLLPGEVSYQAYTAEHVVTQLQLLLFSGLAFFVLLPMLKRTDTISLDCDWLYRKFGRFMEPVIEQGAFYYLRLTRFFFKRVLRNGRIFLINTHGPEGVMARAWPIGVTLMWALLILAGYLVLYYLR